MDLVPYAIPFFALSILLEMAWDKRRGTGFYRLNDAINSLSMGILRTSSKLVIFGFGTLLLLQIMAVVIMIQLISSILNP